MALGTVESAENSSLRAGPARMGKFGAHPSTREFGSLPGRMTPRCYRLGGDKPLSGSRTLNHLWAPTMSSEHEERSRLHRLALTVLSAMQCFTAITASVPRILPGEVDSIEGWAFGAAWIFSAFSPVLLLYLARRAGFFLGLFAAVDRGGVGGDAIGIGLAFAGGHRGLLLDRKSTRLNSSHIL